MWWFYEGESSEQMGGLKFWAMAVVELDEMLAFYLVSYESIPLDAATWWRANLVQQVQAWITSERRG